MCSNNRRVHPAQASHPWSREELSAAYELAQLKVAPVEQIKKLFPGRGLSAVKSKIYALRSGRNATKSEIVIDGFAALDPSDPGVEDQDFPKFEHDTKRGSDRLLSALQRAGYA